MTEKMPNKNYEDDIDVLKRKPKREAPRKEATHAVVVVDDAVESKDNGGAGDNPKPKPSSTPKTPGQKDMRLRFGQSSEKKQVFISEKSRFANMLILGAKHSGKSSTVLPMLARQDILSNDCGITFVVDKKDVAYTLYAMAKEEGRKVTILKPSVDFNIANDFIQQAKYDYAYIDRQIINYKEAIKNKMVVIIDMEYAKYRQNAVRATAMLLMQLQIDMQDTQATLKRPHFVYIDDANRYLPFIELLLTSGDDYGVGTTLFMQGRSQLNSYDTDYSSLVDVNVRNTILMNGIVFDDAKFYLERFAGLTLSDMVDRKEGQILYEVIDPNHTRATGNCGLLFLSDATQAAIEEKAKKYRKQLNKYSRKVEREISIKEEEELNRLNKVKLDAIVKATQETGVDGASKLVKDILDIERKASLERVREEVPEKAVVAAPVESRPVNEPAVIPGIELPVMEEPMELPMLEPMPMELTGDEGGLGLDDMALPASADDLLSELSALNEKIDIPSDGFDAYATEEETTEEFSDVQVINDTRKFLAEQKEAVDENVIELNDTLEVDSMGDDFLYQSRGYRPIKVDMPKKKKAIIASENYLNEMLVKKLK